MYTFAGFEDGEANALGDDGWNHADWGRVDATVNSGSAVSGLPPENGASSTTIKKDQTTYAITCTTPTVSVSMVTDGAYQKLWCEKRCLERRRHPSSKKSLPVTCQRWEDEAGVIRIWRRGIPKPWGTRITQRGPWPGG